MPKSEYSRAGSSSARRKKKKTRSLSTSLVAIISVLALLVWWETKLQDGGSIRSLLQAYTDSLVFHRDRDEDPTLFCPALQKAVLRHDATTGTRRMAVHAFVCNSGHLPLLLNSLISIQRLVSSAVVHDVVWMPIIVLAMNEDLCPQLWQRLHKQQGSNNKNLRNILLCIPEYDKKILEEMQTDANQTYQEYLSIFKQSKNMTLTDTASWGTESHKTLINAKLFALRDILHCGIDTFLTDVDVVFLKDPWPYLEQQEQDHDIVGQNDTNPTYKLNLNSGFMYWRDTSQNRNLTQTLIQNMILDRSDQTQVNELLFDRHVPVKILPSIQFPNGNILGQMNDTQLFSQAVAVHANWNNHLDDKTQVFKSRNLWFVQEEDHEWNTTGTVLLQDRQTPTASNG
ncbi:Inherit from opiNOG: Nucleotide-diphospho-sugar transferase [Seminavis robusta]|uniref:Inherit from opiNOG: Nucleotide-diphospho-sugar transferase n=1 Tax=Seminavis robusta TaxID=568900 RepID=A0A9N8ETV8_9STRA|nr:Inherit from opiNOG: Nucleotide-diphospho-sugar transferase [Seminavis robusta]|eukprot:Sro1749_g295190.1 Inherit from opiNOG: Nucleotide-diphospho-sugar transferase (399) ;mRNA; r:12478-13674